MGELKGLKYLRALFDEQPQELEQGGKESGLVVSFPSPQRVHDWSELPRDISNLIGDKLTFLPHLQKFGTASKEWRGIACEIIETLARKIKNEPPMLLLPYNQETQTATFLDMKNCKTHDLKMPELKDQWICGASNGWLTMMDNNLNLFLFNTVTRARVKLPSLPPYVVTEFDKQINAANISDRYRLIWKVALSGDPSSSNCLVAVIFGRFRKLAVCRLGDEDWTMDLEYSRRLFLEIFFYQGKLFAHQEILSIFVLEYHKQGDLRLLEGIREPFRGVEWSSIMYYFVESSGDLFHVRSVRKPENPWGFEVHRFDPTIEKEAPWSRVYSLGDRSLFYAHNECICMSVKEFPWCKPNCIYFINDRNLFSHYGYEWENGLYSLEENRVIARFDIQHPIPIWPYRPSWYRSMA